MENNKCPFCLHNLPEGSEACSCGAHRTTSWNLKMKSAEERKIAAIGMAVAAFSIATAIVIFNGAAGEFAPARIFTMLCLGFAGTFTATYFCLYDFFKLRKERVWSPAQGEAK